MSTVISLPFAIIQYLKEELQRGTHSEADVESLQVATDCIQAVYNIDYDQCCSQFACQPKLRDIFSSARTLGYFGVSDNGSDTVKMEMAEKLKSEGNNLIKAGMYKEALQKYSDAIDLFPNNAIYYCNRAAAYIKVDRFDAAEADCKKSTALDPKYAKAFWRLGIAQSSLGKHESAEKNFRMACQIEPSNPGYSEALQQSLRELPDQTQQQQTTSNNPSTGYELKDTAPSESSPSYQQEKPPTEAYHAADTNSPNTNQAGVAAQGQNQPGAQPSGMPNMNNINFGSLLSNPNIMNMAMKMMNNPQMMNMFSSALQGGGGIDSMRSMGQHLANENPELVGELKEQLKKDSE